MGRLFIVGLVGIMGVGGVAACSGSTAETLPLTEFDRSYITAVCDANARCCAAFTPSRADCEGQARAKLDELHNPKVSNGVVFSDVFAQRCLDEIRTVDCPSGSMTGSSSSCAHVFTGAGHAGDPCASDLECAGANRCAGTSVMSCPQGAHICPATPTEGQCVADPDLDVACPKEGCPHLAKAGEACSNDGPPCAYLTGCTNGICVSRGDPNGWACTTGEFCLSGYCDYANGTVCGPSPSCLTSL